MAYRAASPFYASDDERTDLLLLCFVKEHLHRLIPLACGFGCEQFTRFDLECDHDYIEILDASSNQILWKGGCFREGVFAYQATSAVLIRFVSDDSVAKGGIQIALHRGRIINCQSNSSAWKPCGTLFEARPR